MRRSSLARRVADLDRALFDRFARRDTPWLDATLPALSRAADHSRLWLVAAACLAAAGGRRGQRAALRGVGSIGATSLLVNQVAKRLVRRPRPSLRAVPAVRRLRAQPLTTSFPSGHAASAAAFAVAVGSELPAARVPLGAVAAAVAASRVHVGVHYPLDVATGAAAGASVAALSRLQWPVLPAEADRRPPTLRALRLEPRGDGRGVAIVVNSDAGSRLTTPPIDELREALPQARIVEVRDARQLERALNEAAASCEVLGIAGGDGSTTTAAQVAVARGRPLLVIPAGTLNHLGRDLRVEGARDALAALAAGQAAAIDLAEIDGRPFLNTAGFGAYPRMLDMRAQLEKRIGRWPAHVIAAAATLVRSRPVAVAIDGRERRVWTVFVANCLHEPPGFAPTWRPRLDDGLLDVRLLSGERPLARVRLLLSILSGRLARSPAYERLAVRELRVDARGRPLRLAHDGESFDGSASFTVRKLPRQLVAYAPSA